MQPSPREDFQWVLEGLPTACTVALVTSTVSDYFEEQVPRPLAKLRINDALIQLHLLYIMYGLV